MSRIGAQAGSDYKRSEREEILIGPPLDLSFKKAATMDELEQERPQTIRTGKVPTRTARDRFITSTLWLSHNSLKSMDGLEKLVKSVLEDPTLLGWLDLSFNALMEINDEVARFPNLRILYLHGNNISNINYVLRLRKMCNLRTLTLHGNPIETQPYYRGYIVHVMQQLTSLDFSPVTLSEKTEPLPIGFFKIIRPSFASG